MNILCCLLCVILMIYLPPINFLNQLPTQSNIQQTIPQPIPAHPMLSYFSKTVTKAYKASKRVLQKNQPLYKETMEYKLLRSLQKYQSQLLPSQGLSQLAGLTYDSQKFYLIFDVLMLRIRTDDNVLDLESSKGMRELRNCLVICSYLVRNGASGYIDQFRQQIDKFKTLNWYLNSLSDTSPTKSQNYKSALSQSISRISYFIDLLLNNQKLQKQKNLSMLIKKKLKQSPTTTTTTSTSTSTQANKKKERTDNFLNNYVWRYIQYIDDKLDAVAEVLAEKLEKYLLEDVPDGFEIDELEVRDQIGRRSQADFGDFRREEREFVNARIGVNDQPISNNPDKLTNQQNREEGKGDMGEKGQKENKVEEHMDLLS